MSKLTREQKIEIYNKSINGYSLKSLSKEYNVRSDNIQYLIRLIRFHGFKTLSELKSAMEEYIHYYNNQRISLKLKGLTPVQYRHQSLFAI